MEDKSGRSKIVLPTPETCGWRGAQANGSAHCGLLGSLMGHNLDSGVTSQQCDACCNTFPPTPKRLNPVIASILYSRLSKLGQDDAEGQCSPALSKQLMSIAEKALHDDNGRESSLPLRAWHRCCFLGSAVVSEGGNTDQEFHCLHPSHDRTSIPRCKLCHDWAFQPPLSRKLALHELVPSTPVSDRVKNWAVGVTTSPRRQPTLGACLEGWKRAGWDDVHLFLDGSVNVPAEYVCMPTTWREHPIGACPSWLLSLAELVAIHPEADAYAMFQDDAYPHYGDSLRDYLEKALWPGCRNSLVSLYNPGLRTVRGWDRIPADWDWGTLAVIFPPRLARSFLSDPTVVRRSLPEQAGQHRPIPEVVREWAHRRAIEVWCPSPSLVQHIGSTSTIWPHAGLVQQRRSPWFSADLQQPMLQDEGLDDFQESAFPCKPCDQPRYREKVAKGKERMREISVVICGISRDVRPLLPRTAARIERLGAMFGDYQVLIFENDSVDGTLEFYRDWERQNHRIKVLSERLGMPRFPQTRSLDRAAALADCRNRYLDYLGNSGDAISHAVVLDTDLVGGWSYDGIANSFGHDDWDFIGSYGLDHYPTPPQRLSRRWHYDSWALRASRTSAARMLIDNRSESLQRGMPMLEVESCFGGLGLYRIECLLECRYGGGDCEHVVLHHRMRRSGYTRLFLNPSQIVLRSALVH